MERRLEVDLQEASIRIHASVRLPTETAAVEWAGRGQLAPRDFLRWLFGLSLGSDDPRPGRASAADPRPQFTREFDAATGTTVLMLEFTAPRSGFAFQTVQPALMSQPGDHVTIEAARQDRLQTGRPAPARTETDGRVRLEWQQVDAGSAGVQARLETPPSESAAAPGSPEDRANLGAQARQTSAITAVQRLRDVLPRRINEMGYWLLAAIPCLWFIAILRRNTAVAERIDMARLATGLFMLHVAYVAVTAFEFDLYGLVAPWLAGRAQDEVGLARNVAVGLGGALPLATLAAWILFLRLDRWLPAAEPQAGHTQGRGWFLARLFFIWPLAVAVLALVVAGPFVLQGWAQASKVEWRNQVWVLAQVGPTGVALLLGWVFVYWCLRSATGRPGSVAVAWLVSWTLLIVPALPLVFDAGVEQLRQALLAHGLSPLLVPWNAGSAVWPAVCLLVGMSLSWAIGRRALKLIRWTPLAEWTPRTRRLVAAGTLFVFALPMVDESGFATPWLLVHFHYYMLRLTPFVLLACLWALLRQANPEDRFRLSAVEADLGLLLFAFYLCGGATHLLLVPIPLITGWWLARHYLLRPVAIGPEAAPSKASILRSLVGLREAERLQAVLRRHSEKKYGEGAISRDDYERGLALAAERVSAARRALHLGDREARRALFGHGPGTGPMANAWLAVRLGLPLIVLFQLAAIDRSLQVDVGRFPLLELVTPHVVTGSYWLVAAFLFGYFFHALRGGDGLSKGAAFGLSLLLPTLCVLVLNQQSLLAPTAAEQFLRIGLFASYLALSFDARVVRQAGFELRHLVLVYGIAPSFALASSLAALGGLSLAPVLKLAGCWSMRTLGFEVCAP